MFDVDSVNADHIHFGKGGYQGCRGGPGQVDNISPHGIDSLPSLRGFGRFIGHFVRFQDWFVENVLELLDSGGEHYIDLETKTLYYQANSTTGPPPSDLNAEVPVLMALLVGNATQAAPIVNFTMQGL